MKDPNNKPKFVIAGPGAGKTYGTVHEIARVMPELKPNRTLAAITYTNAAADSIRTKLHQIIRISPNVFIGTIHSFLNQFILLPYATLFDHLPMEKTPSEVSTYLEGHLLGSWRKLTLSLTTTASERFNREIEQCVSGRYGLPSEESARVL